MGGIWPWNVMVIILRGQKIVGEVNYRTNKANRLVCAFTERSSFFSFSHLVIKGRMQGNTRRLDQKDGKKGQWRMGGTGEYRRMMEGWVEVAGRVRSAFLFHRLVGLGRMDENEEWSVLAQKAEKWTVR